MKIRKIELPYRIVDRESVTERKNKTIKINQVVPKALPDFLCQ